ncbi:hypothetical protein HK096_003339, partial [Nowakowskiella sp. JEL0078]
MSEFISSPTVSWCWMQNLNDDSGSFVLLVSSILMLYGYLVSNKRRLWAILLVNSISGILGILIQSAFKSFNNDLTIVSSVISPCNKVVSDDAQRVLGILLGVNEFFWYLNEISTVLYAFLKIETVTSSTLPVTVSRIIRYALLFWATSYFPLRVYIGYLRATHHVVFDADIMYAHGYAYISWGVMELVILGMLVHAVLFVKSEGVNGKSMVAMVLSSSVFRLLLISLNQVAIAFVARYAIIRDQIQNYEPLSVVNLFIWLARGVYPAILLMDILSTQSLLFHSVPPEEGRQSDTERSKKSSWNTDYSSGISTGIRKSESIPESSQNKETIMSLKPVSISFESERYIKSKIPSD